MMADGQARVEEEWVRQPSGRFRRTPKEMQAAPRAQIAKLRLVEEFFRSFEETSSERRVFVAAQVGEFLQLGSLLGIQFRRNFDQNPDQQIATLTPIDVHDAFAAKLEHLRALGSGGNFEIRLPFQRRHVDFAAERGEGKRDRHFAVQIVFIALENLVLLNVNDNVKIALRSTSNSRFAVA